MWKSNLYPSRPFPIPTRPYFRQWYTSSSRYITEFCQRELRYSSELIRTISMESASIDPTPRLSIFDA